VPRTYTELERALLASAHFGVHVKVELTDQQGDWVDVTALSGRDYLIGARWSRTIDTPVMSGTLTLSRSVRGLSIVPTIVGSAVNYNDADVFEAFIHGGQRVRISTAITAAGELPLGGDWREVFLGKVDDPEWGGTPNTMVLAISDIGSYLVSKQIAEARPYSTDDGVPVQTIMQQILDDNESAALGPIVLYTPINPGWNIRKYEQQAGVSVLDALRALASQIGWDVRFMYDAAGVFRLTFWSPDRAKVDPDSTFGPDEYFELPTVGENTSDIRNHIVVRFIDHDTGEAMFAEYRDEESIDTYDEQYMEVAEDASSNIDSMVEAQQMADAIGSDLSTPYLSQRMRTTYAWFVELADLHEYVANDVHYDTNQKLAVVTIEHELSRTGYTTIVGVRGKPSTSYAEWLKKQGVGVGVNEDDDALDFKNFREDGRTSDGITYTVDGFSPGVAETWVYELVLSHPIAPGTDPYDLIRTSVTPQRYDTATKSWTFEYPPLNSTRFVQLETRDAAFSAHGIRRPIIQAAGVNPWITDTKQTPNVGSQSCKFQLIVQDALKKGGTLRVWTNRSSTANADPTLPPDGSIDVALTPATIDHTSVFNLTGGGTSTLFAAIPIHNGHGKRIHVEFVNSEGASSGVLAFNLTSQLNALDPDGDIGDGKIDTATQFASTIQPVQVFATTLPEPAADGTFAFLVSTGKLYRRSGGVWTAAVPAVDITGQIVASQVADGAINTAKFATGIRPVRIVTSLPASGDLQGDTVFLTTDNKLYRWTGAAWTSAVASVDLTGTIDTAQIADAAITAQKIGAAAVTTVKIATGNITTALIAASNITTTLIADDAITTPKILAGQITAAKIASHTITANEIQALTITAAEIAAGTITGAKIAAGTITAANIQALTITAAEIAANTITGGKIAANTITASNIAADTITAGEIAAGAISTSELAAGAVNASKIAAGTITANEIAANTITGGKIASATITATNIAGGTITSNELASNSIIAGKIAAGAINASAIIVDGVITAAKISVTTLAAINSNLGIIVAGKLSSVNGQSYVDLNATGSSAFVRHATSGGTETVRLNADGSAVFGGTVSSSSFTANVADFEFQIKVGRLRASGSAEVHSLWLYGDTSAIAYGIVFSIDTVPYGSSSDYSGASGFTNNLRGANFDFGYAYNQGVMMAKVIASAAGPSGTAPEGTLWCQV
jgi:hypothetical protein